MVNIWGYANTLPYVALKAVDGRSCPGQIICVMGSEETYFDEDSLAIEMDSGEIVTFMQSEIGRIKVLKGDRERYDVHRNH